MKLTMLGTGNATVTKCYNTCFTIENNNEYFLVDAGGGNTILSMLQRANIDIKKIKAIFVTHKHIDHLLGIIWLIRIISTKMNQGLINDKVYIYSHKEVIDLITELANKLLLFKQYSHLNKDIILIALNDGDSFKAINLNFKAFDIHSTKDLQYGFTMYFKDKKLTCLGDETYNELNYSYAINSDYLMHDAFCLDSKEKEYKAYDKHHSTALDAGINANKLNCKSLIIYHTEDDDLENRKKLYSAEASINFKGIIYVPNDLEVIELDD